MQSLTKILQDYLRASHHEEDSNQARYFDCANWLLVERKLRESLPNHSRVCVLVSSKSHGIDCLAGILLSGNVFVPLDVLAPSERNLKILQNIRPTGLLLDNQTLGIYKSLNMPGVSYSQIGIGQLTLVELTWHEPTPPNPDNLAIILHTSGSTGTPNGVMISHSNALSFINWANQTFSFSNKDVFSSIAPLHFDLAIFDVFVSLRNQSELKCYDPGIVSNPLLLASKIAEDQITVLYATPTLLKTLMNFGKIEKYDFSNLRYILFAGEVFPFEDLNKLMSIWPQAEFFNLYGPTETNVCTFYPITKSRLTELVPIGAACEPNVIKIVGDEAQGELMVSGPNVSLGYWNNDVLNEEKFTVDQYGVRWYLTGDIVRKNGLNYTYLGRSDRMIKRRGYRIELGEIEQVISTHPEIAQVAVMIMELQEEHVSIKAFYQTKPNSNLVNSQLRMYCVEKLPLYMIPDEFQLIDEIPTTSTHKIDYQKLKLSLYD